MTRLALRQDEPSSRLSAAQGGGAVGFVIMGDTLNIAEPDGQHRLGAFQRLDLALFIRRRKRVPVRWIEIQADSAAQLLDEEGIGGNLEAAGPTRLQGEELKQSMHGPLGKSGLVSHGAHAPMGCCLGFARERLADQRDHGLVLDRPRPARPHLVVKPLQAVCDEAAAPLADSIGAEVEVGGNCLVVRLALAGKDDLGPQNQGCRHAPTSGRSPKVELAPCR